MEKERIAADIAIIGAGVVGCAIARDLSIFYPQKKIVVIEKLASHGLETSSFNSGVLHSGLHQDPRFLKSKLARKGSVLAVEYSEKTGVPIMHTGMIIAVSAAAIRTGLWREWQNLAGLIQRGKEQHIPFSYLTRWGVRKLEPNLSALGGIFIPNVWVIDPKELVARFYCESRDRDVRFLFSRSVDSVTSHSTYYNLHTFDTIISAGAVVNSAGLYADEVARLAGFPDYQIYPWRGEYYEIIGEKRGLVRRLVYPAVPHNCPGKGIHFSPRVDGRLFVGPNARKVPRKNYYVEDKTPVGEFLEAVKKFCPAITERDMQWAYSGIRPKTTAGEEESDFIIRLDRIVPPWINLIGIESPGLSSAMAIAEYVRELLQKCS